jgi:hypothetical protein
MALAPCGRRPPGSWQRFRIVEERALLRSSSLPAAAASGGASAVSRLHPKKMMGKRSSPFSLFREERNTGAPPGEGLPARKRPGGDLDFRTVSFAQAVRGFAADAGAYLLRSNRGEGGWWLGVFASAFYAAFASLR